MSSIMQTIEIGATIAERAKGVSHQHRSSVNDGEEAELSVDYAFMTKEGVVELEKNMNEAEKVGAAPILVGCDHR